MCLQPELYVTTPQHVFPGEPILAEAMCINGSASQSVEIEVQLYDSAGTPYGPHATSTVTPHSTADATTLPSLTVDESHAGQFLRARARMFSAGGALLQEVTSAPIIIFPTNSTPTPMLRRLYYSVPAYAALPGVPTLTVSASPVDNPGGTATVTALAGTNVRFSEVIQNTRQISNGFTTNPYSVTIPMAPRTVNSQVTSALAAGFYMGRIIDEQERVGYSDPLYLA